jgi:hypothetical protein
MTGHSIARTFFLTTAGIAILGGAVPASARAGGLAPPEASSHIDLAEHPIPSFSRQTGLACNMCHTAFLQLTPFGRSFKLNGYTLSNTEKVTSGSDAVGQGLSIDRIPGVSFMLQTSVTHVARPEPGTQNDQAELPDQFSLFAGGAITPSIGAFVQVTYAGPDGTIGFDNVDLRFARPGTLRGKPLTYGITVNNNPTVQDLWNSTPAWGWPFTGSAVAPTPAAGTVVEGSLAQQVVGLGGYLFWNNLLYAELSAYRSAPQGGAHPADASSEQTLRGVSPYWRVALSREGSGQSFEVGTFGLATRWYPTGVTGPTDRYLDLGMDAQYQRNLGGPNLTAHATYVRERRTLDATFAAGDALDPHRTLRSFKLDAQLVTPWGFAPGVGYFTTTGDPDAALYPTSPVDGSATGSPDSSGVIAELDFNPWLNTRLAAQYVLYGSFNGRGDNYDGAGRDAADNNTLYLTAWVVF